MLYKRVLVKDVLLGSFSPKKVYFTQKTSCFIDPYPRRGKYRNYGGRGGAPREPREPRESREPRENGSRNEPRNNERRENEFRDRPRGPTHNHRGGFKTRSNGIIF